MQSSDSGLDWPTNCHTVCCMTKTSFSIRLDADIDSRIRNQAMAEHLPAAELVRRALRQIYGADPRELALGRGLEASRGCVGPAGPSEAARQA
jgi:predicted transcriptional regulator